MTALPLEQQVCSLDLAVRMNTLGVKQESAFLWTLDVVDGFVLKLRETEAPDDHGMNCHAAFTVAELGEMLPRKIEEKAINAAYPIPDLPGDVSGDEWDRIEESREAAREKLQDALCSFEGDTDQFEDGMSYDIKLSFNDGKEVSYYQLTDDWENNCQVIEMRGDTEADARAKMLIHLIENKLVRV